MPPSLPTIYVHGAKFDGTTVDLSSYTKIKMNASIVDSDSLVHKLYVDTQVSVQTARIDAILAGSSLNLDSLKEVSDYISSLDSTAQGNLLASVTALNTALASEATAARAAEATLTTNLASEATTARAAEATLTTNLASEATTARAAEATLTTNLASEATTARAAEATLTTNLASEATTARAAEATLTTNLASEATTARAAEATLTTNLASEATTARAAEAAELARASAAELQIKQHKQIDVVVAYNSNVWADGKKPQVPIDAKQYYPGWYVNRSLSGGKHNWYLSVPPGMKVSNIKTTQILTNFLASAPIGDVPFVNFYTAKQNDGKDNSSWFRSSFSFTLDNAAAHNNLGRVSLNYKVDSARELYPTGSMYASDNTLTLGAFNRFSTGNSFAEIGDEVVYLISISSSSTQSTVAEYLVEYFLLQTSDVTYRYIFNMSDVVQKETDLAEEAARIASIADLKAKIDMLYNNFFQLPSDTAVITTDGNGIKSISF
jgi:hypothetical protein